MLIWGLVLFALGALAVLDSLFSYGHVFRSANSVLFLLVSLGILTRTRSLEKLRFKEQLLESKNELRAHLEQMKRTKNSPEKSGKSAGKESGLEVAAD